MSVRPANVVKVGFGPLRGLLTVRGHCWHCLPGVTVHVAGPGIGRHRVRVATLELGRHLPGDSPAVGCDSQYRLTGVSPGTCCTNRQFRNDLEILGAEVRDEVPVGAGDDPSICTASTPVRNVRGGSGGGCNDVRSMATTGLKAAKGS